MRENASYLAFMMDHAAGTHEAAFALAGDLHVLLSQSGAEIAHDWSMIGGAVLAQVAAREVATRPLPPGQRLEYVSMTASDLIELADSEVKWRRGLSGVFTARIGVPGACLMKLEPGQSAPMHGHSDLEATVVIRGRFSDGRAEYQPGDLVFGGPGVRHKPQAIGNEACICYVAERHQPFWRFLT